MKLKRDSFRITNVVNSLVAELLRRTPQGKQRCHPAVGVVGEDTNNMYPFLVAINISNHEKRKGVGHYSTFGVVGE